MRIGSLESIANKIDEIVITGGPCAGKTTGFCYLSEKLMDLGFRTIVVPEVATMIIGGGIHDISEIAGNDKNLYFQIEKQMLLLQRDLRSRFNKLASLFPTEKKIILYDRAEMDVMAYVSKNYFRAMLEDHRLTLHDVRDSYSGIIHLVTAANGAEKFYTTENNKARRESSLKAARLADEKTQQAWTGHSHLKVIDNSTGFEEKMRRAFRAISRIAGIPVPLEIERKFLIEKSRIEDLFGYGAQEIDIEQMYLISPNKEKEVRIRKRSQWGSSTYYRTEKTRFSPLVRQETERFISSVEYLNLQKFQDPAGHIIRKKRYCFLYRNQYFELDMIYEPEEKCFLEIELTEEHDFVDLPPFLKIKKEVTGDSNFSNYAIAFG